MASRSGKDEARDSESDDPALFSPTRIDFSKLQTRTGKPLHDGGETDQYTSNTAPSRTVLSKFAATKLTDDEKRVYWLADSIKGLDWEFMREIKASPTFDALRDVIFFVRPAPGTPSKDFTLPEVIGSHRQIFYTTNPRRKWTAVVKDSGVDQISSSESSRSRKSSYVVLSDLRPATAAARR